MLSFNPMRRFWAALFSKSILKPLRWLGSFGRVKRSLEEDLELAVPVFSWKGWLKSLFCPRVATIMRKPRMPRFRLSLLLEELEPRLAPSVSWTGGSSTDSNWSDTSNWNATPTTGAALLFSGTTRPSTTDDISSSSFSALTFSSTGFSIAPSPSTNTLTLTGAGGITVQNSDSATISASLILSNSAPTITLGSGSTLTISGTLSDTSAASILVTGGGTLILSGSNANLAGTITVS